jgi:hypothetical protein
MTKEIGLLQVFDSLPDLLALARQIKERDGGYAYEIQDNLRKEHRKKKLPFKWSMPYRHIDRCDQCDYYNTAIKHELENPQIKDHSSPLHQVQLWAMDIHKIREHQVLIPPDLQDFLTHVAQKS